MVRPLPSNVQRVQVRSLVGELRSHMSCGHKAKHRSNIVTNSIKVFKNGLHLKKSYKIKCGKLQKGNETKNLTGCEARQREGDQR